MTPSRVDPAKAEHLQHRTSLSQRHGGDQTTNWMGIIIGVVVVAAIAVIVIINL